jgi:hypothetical protein
MGAELSARSTNAGSVGARIAISRPLETIAVASATMTSRTETGTPALASAGAREAEVRSCNAECHDFPSPGRRTHTQR